MISRPLSLIALNFLNSQSAKIVSYSKLRNRYKKMLMKTDDGKPMTEGGERGLRREGGCLRRAPMGEPSKAKANPVFQLKNWIFLFLSYPSQNEFCSVILKTRILRRTGAVFALALRREGGSNPRSRDSGTTVFETAAFDHSAISPVVIRSDPQICAILL